jgi:hypothetical protein
VVVAAGVTVAPGGETTTGDTRPAGVAGTAVAAGEVAEAAPGPRRYLVKNFTPASKACRSLGGRVRGVAIGRKEAFSGLPRSPFRRPRMPPPKQLRKPAGRGDNFVRARAAGARRRC